MPFGKGRCWRFRRTQAREALIELLSRTKGHLSAEEIFWELKKVLPGVGLATVYRTLDLLTEIGLIKRYDFKDGKARYEFIHNDNAEHYHLICKNCGKIIDYELTPEEDPLKDFKNSIQKKLNFKIESSDLQFYGLCENCQKLGK